MPRTRPPAEKPTVICFVRHGSTPTTGKVLPGRARGLHLSDAGRSEARAAGERLAGLPVAGLYASPLERARETAKEIGSVIGHRPVVERGLLECDFGEWTGQELASLAKRPEWRTVQRWPSGFRFPGGESFRELQSRMESTVARLRVRHPGELVVAVSHADCIKAALVGALGVPLDLFQRLVVGPCSASVVSYGPEGPAVLAVNTYGRLPSLEPARAESSGSGTSKESRR